MNTLPSTSGAWLLADVGGTNVRFALCQPGEAAPLRMDSIGLYRVQDFPGIEDAAAAYLQAMQVEVRHAVFAVAGRIEAGTVQLTNNAWRIASEHVRQTLGLQSAQLVNDFAAISMALPLLEPQDTVALAGGEPLMMASDEALSFCVLGPGTGLGVAALRLHHGRPFVLQTEGGHTSFAPVSELEITILQQLTRRFGRVSNERLICGSGLVNIYQALCGLEGQPARDLTPEQVSTQGASGVDALCQQAVHAFCGILGTLAGDFALSYAAWNGVFLAGAWLKPLLPQLRQGLFHQRFVHKGRFEAIMQKVPVALITHPQPGLLGAAGFAVSASGHQLPPSRLGPGASAASMLQAASAGRNAVA